MNTDHKNPYNKVLSKYKRRNLYYANIKYISYGIIIVSLVNIALTLWLQLSGSAILNSDEFARGKSGVFGIIIAIAIINVFIIRSKNDRFYKNMIDVSKISNHPEILQYYFPLLEQTQKYLKRKDAMVVSSIICSYFQEKKRVLGKTDYISLLKKIFADDAVNEAYEIFDGPRKVTDKQYNDLEKALPDLENLIQWHEFYGWQPYAFSCTSPLIYRTEEFIKRKDEMTDQEMFEDIEKKGSTFSSDILFLMKDTKKQKRKSEDLHEDYLPAAISARKIVGQYIESMKDPQTVNYPSIGTPYLGLDRVVKNDDYALLAH